MKRIITVGALLAALFVPAAAHAEPSQWAVEHTAMQVGETIVVAPGGHSALHVTLQSASGRRVKLTCTPQPSLALSNDGVHGLAEWETFTVSACVSQRGSCPAATVQAVGLPWHGVLQTAFSESPTSFLLETPVQLDVSCTGRSFTPFSGTMLMYPGDFDCVANPSEDKDEIDHDLKWKRASPTLANSEGATLMLTGGFLYEGPEAQKVGAYLNGEPTNCGSKDKGE